MASMANLIIKYVNSLDRLCKLAGTTASAYLKNMCLDNLSETQLIEGEMLFEYHCRRILAENARKETEHMIKTMRNNLLEQETHHHKRMRTNDYYC